MYIYVYLYVPSNFGKRHDGTDYSMPSLIFKFTFNYLLFVHFNYLPFSLSPLSLLHLRTTDPFLRTIKLIVDFLHFFFNDKTRRLEPRVKKSNI